ncbi:MAG: hypothetical protein JW395_0316 [Nitrospira sp.]|nr:hypothetical protein [Nitrospira sp.]
MATLTSSYFLGSCSDVAPLYPAADFIDPVLGLKDDCAIIAQFTVSSMKLDGFASPMCGIKKSEDGYQVEISAQAELQELEAFAQRHQALVSPGIGGKALAGRDLMMKLGVWNPMEGYPVNRSKTDGACKWSVFLPLGMGLLNHKAVMLLHYPPWQALREASYLNNMTLQRWVRLLKAAGAGNDDLDGYKTIMDVNPVAAPGSGQSEYPNDYFPIMMSSAFFDCGGGLDYIRSMLEFLLCPPTARSDKFTLPLLIGGSPLYDPQAPGWLRVAFKDLMPRDENDIPQANVMQTGTIRIRPDSPKLTPYMICNHMIAAGVTGKCTADAGAIPDIRQYEAQDLVAASFLMEYGKNPDINPTDAKVAACQRWYGNDAGTGAPNPPAAEDRLTLCALGQMDLFFSPTPTPHPTYTLDEAIERCKTAGANNDPCSSCIPLPPKGK